MAIIPIFAGGPMVYSSSMHLFRQTLAVNSVWQRPELALEDLRCVHIPASTRSYFNSNIRNFFRLLGDNVFASVGETWKRHRRVLAPAFTQSMYKNVWSVSERMYDFLCDEDGWNKEKVVKIDDINRLTRKVCILRGWSFWNNVH